MGQITVDQSHQVVATLVTNTTWEEIDFEGAGLQNLVIRNPKEAGRQFTAFLKNGGRVIVGEPRIIPIDRTAPFDPVKWLGQGWTIEEQDKRSLALEQVDLANVRLEHMLKKDESWIKGDEKLKRLKKAGYIRLDAKVFQTFWENQALIPESWKEKTNGNTTFIFFDGTILRDPYGSRYVLYLYWRDGRWHWSCHWLEGCWNVIYPSAVLASI
jgi:hypothetical protein